MSIVNIKLKGKYTLKCLKFIVFTVIMPITIITFYLVVYQTEKLKTILEVIYNPVLGSG